MIVLDALRAVLAIAHPEACDKPSTRRPYPPIPNNAAARECMHPPRTRITADIDPKVTAMDAPTARQPEFDVVPARNEYDDQGLAARRAWLAARTGVDLGALDLQALTPESVQGNIENLVGAVAIPVGLAGPLELHGEHARGSIVAPFATTEGALVAATTRGAQAINRDGGVRVRVLARRMLRAPMFGFADGEHAERFAAWAPTQLPALARVVEASSRHARLLELRPYGLGRDVHLLLSFETGDAAGQNMSTLATALCCRWLQDEWAARREVAPQLCLVEGQMSGDKNLSALGLVHGRGARVSAECVLSRRTLEAALKCAPERLARAHQSGMAGALQAGVLGYNANIANVLAAMFTATGQDIACEHESALGILTLDTSGGELYANLVLPSLVVGSVGGGTQLPSQRTCLELLGCAGAGKVLRLAEIVCGFALALDLSSYAAMVAGHFAEAHARLGRRPAPAT